MDAMMEALAGDGWTAIDCDPLPGDDARHEMGYTGFGGLVPPDTVEQRFKLGRIVVTPGARTALALGGEFDADLVRMLLTRFLLADWGVDTPPDRAALNQSALTTDDRIAACYPVGYGAVVWLLSDWDRRQTCIVGAGEYR